ncbi:MAG: hypothetical protein GEU78_06750 [Actinobacteria bacterium]|nr:hypothetical protein [Actinomycetota bacterium]
MKALATQLAAGIRGAVSPEVGDADVDRMVRLYEKSADAMTDIRRGLVQQDRQLYESGLRRKQKAAGAPDRLARSFGLDECVNFISVGGR